MFFDQYSALCKAEGKTPNGVAKELGLPSSSVTQWRQGGTPRPKTLRLIADRFAVSVEYLLTGDSPGDKKERPAENGGTLKESLPEDIRQLLSICRENPALASALLSVAQQIEKGPAAQGKSGKE